MSVTLNAHQFGRLIERTVDHIGDEYTPALHGVRLEADGVFLYAVASDRYTLAVARYRHHGLTGEPFARILPAPALPALRRWAADQPGSDPVTLTLTEGKVRFAAPRGEIGVAVDDGQEFFGWRGILRGAIEQPPADADADAVAGTEGVFPVLDSRLWARFAGADHHVCVRVTAGRQPLLLVGEDFIGAQMPLRSRREGFDTGLAEDLDHVRALWDGTFADTPAGTMPDDLPTARRSADGASRTVAETAEVLLRQTLRSTHDLLEENSTSPAAVAAHATAWRISSARSAWSSTASCCGRLGTSTPPSPSSALRATRSGMRTSPGSPRSSTAT